MNVRLKKNKKKKGFRFSNITAPFKNEKTHKKVGFFILLIASYLLIAFVSFLFNWKKDMDKISAGWAEALSNAEVLVENSLGKLGALISHWFIFQGFLAFLIDLFFVFYFLLFSLYSLLILF